MAVAARFSSNSNKTLLGRSLQSVLFLYLAQDIFSKNSDNSNSKDRDSLTDVFTTSQTDTSVHGHMQSSLTEARLPRALAQSQRTEAQVSDLQPTSGSLKSTGNKQSLPEQRVAGVFDHVSALCCTTP